MCFGGLQTTGQTNGSTAGTTNSTTTNNSASTGATAQNIDIDPTLRDQATNNTDYLTGTRDEGYTPYAGDRVAQPWGQSQNVSSNLDRMANEDMPPMVQQGYERAQYYGNAPAQHVGTERVVDENGNLGAIKDYTNPYIKQVLDPQLQDLDEEGFRRNKEMNSRAAMAGAFGDTGWEFGRAREADLTRRQRGALIGNANKDAFDRAMQLRQTDAGRFLDVDKTNASLQEQALERQYKAADWMGKFGIMNSQNRQGILAALDKSGQAFQAGHQKDLDAAYQEFSRQTGFPLEVSQMLISAINGSPLNRDIQSTTDTANNSTSVTGTNSNTVGTTTGQTQTPNNSGFNLLGTLLGGLF